MSKQHHRVPLDGEPTTIECEHDHRCRGCGDTNATEHLELIDAGRTDPEIAFCTACVRKLGAQLLRVLS